MGNLMLDCREPCASKIYCNYIQKTGVKISAMIMLWTSYPNPSYPMVIWGGNQDKQHWWGEGLLGNVCLKKEEEEKEEEEEHAFTLSTQEANAGKSRIQGQSGL